MKTCDSSKLCRDSGWVFDDYGHYEDEEEVESDEVRNQFIVHLVIAFGIYIADHYRACYSS